MPLKTTLTGSFGNLEVSIVDWRPGDPFPKLGKAISNDNETELITVRKPIPALVVAGFYNHLDRTCYLVYPDGIKEWWSRLSETDTLVYMFNAAFDVPTSETKTAFSMLDQNRILDVGINAQLYNIATEGDLAFDAMSLKGAAHKYIKMELDKGEEDGDQADRLTFRRGILPTDSQKIYLAGDLASTYFLGDHFVPQPTIFMQTRADLVLSTITRNGMLVDKVVWDHLVKTVDESMKEARKKLDTFGFPVKDDQKKNFSDILKERVEDVLGPQEKISKQHMARLLAFLQGKVEEALSLATSGEFSETIQEDALKWAFQESSLKRLDRERCDRFLEKVDGKAFDLSRKRDAFPALILAVLDAIGESTANDLHQNVKEKLGEVEEVLEPAPEVGPVKFLQDYVKGLMQENPKLQLETTPTGKVKVSKMDAWRFEDAGVHSEFLDAYVEFKHNEKLMSTYLNPKFIQEDGRIHPHFGILVRTGRTSSGGRGSINAQNIPARGGLPLRNMVTAAPGWVLLQTDYSSLEMAGLAQHCYSRYGISRLRDVLNAGVDPHRWFAGVFTKVINADDLKLDPESVAELSEFLTGTISKRDRNLAKVYLSDLLCA